MTDFEILLLSIVMIVSALNIYTILQLRKSEANLPSLKLNIFHKKKEEAKEKVDEEKEEEQKVIELE